MRIMPSRSILEHAKRGQLRQMRVERGQKALAHHAEREHFRARIAWSIEANASRARAEALLADYAEQEHFRARKAWSVEN